MGLSMLPCVHDNWAYNGNATTDHRFNVSAVSPENENIAGTNPIIFPWGTHPPYKRKNPQTSWHDSPAS